MKRRGRASCAICRKSFPGPSWCMRSADHSSRQRRDGQSICIGATTRSGPINSLARSLPLAACRMDGCGELESRTRGDGSVFGCHQRRFANQPIRRAPAIVVCAGSPYFGSAGIVTFGATGAQIKTLHPKSAIRFLFTQTLPAGRGIFSPFCVSERAPPVRYALRRQFRSHPQAFWGVLAAAPPPTPSSWRQRRRECRTRDHDVSGMTHPSCMKRTQRSRIAVNTASMAELIFKNVCLPCRTILPAV